MCKFNMFITTVCVLFLIKEPGIDKTYTTQKIDQNMCVKHLICRKKIPRVHVVIEHRSLGVLIYIYS